MYGFVFGIPNDIIFPIVKIVLFVHWQCAIFLKTMGKTRGSSLDKTDSVSHKSFAQIMHQKWREKITEQVAARRCRK